MTLCIIPARGGSKRIPRKNIKLFHGKPMIAYSIQAALKSACFEHIIVSTDDEEIAQVAREHGATTPFMRPKNLADDFATTGDVMRHAISEMQKQGWQGEQVCCLYATAPFVRAEDLINGQKTLSQQQADFAFSITNYAFPIQRALLLDENQQVRMLQPEHFFTRSQDLPETWHDAGQFYWGKTEAWLAEKPIFNSHSIGIKLPRFRVQDIDTPEDWQQAELLAQAIYQKPANLIF